METSDQTAVAVVEPERAVPALVPAATKSRAVLMREQIEAETEIRQLLKGYIDANMREGADFGVIPGTDKPTLLKPGAEKLVDLFRCEPDFEVTQRVEDWEQGLFHYELKCVLRGPGGGVSAQGMGSANSREGRYRWRNAGRTCPDCGKETIIKGKAQYGGGWLCFPKKGGCGNKWDDGDQRIEGQQLGKVENDDIYTLVNTILKMAKKRALVDGAIALARCSDLFTQDVEDLGDHVARPQQQQQKRRSTPPPAANGDPGSLVLDFGKHKGKKLSEVPADYVQWLAGKARDEHVRKAAEQLSGSAGDDGFAPPPSQEFPAEQGGDTWGLSGDAAPPPSDDDIPF